MVPFGDASSRFGVKHPHGPLEVFHLYREAIPLVADWNILADLTQRVAYDRRLRGEERDTLFRAITVRESCLRPTRPDILVG